MTTHQPDHIHVLVCKCFAAFDRFLNMMRQQGPIERFPEESQIRVKRYEFCRWSERFGANLVCSSTISLDYKFRNHDYPRETILSQLGHLLSDIEGLEKMYKEKNTQSEARLSLTRIAGIIEELNRFLNTLPKEEWLESPEDPVVWIG
ncbi:hypothetical protein NCS52_00849400 [Fusarium sp. LHS14.1]|nr:hypothetical protein NCS52_00849400 [Fusarium sp. LHS14.1]